MRKIISALLALAMVFSLCACGAKKETADAPVSKFCEAMQTFDFDAMRACLGGSAAEEFPDADGLLGGMSDLLDYMTSNAKSITFAVTAVRPEGNEAQVDVKFGYTDCSAAAAETLGELTREMLAAAPEELETTDFDAQFVERFTKNARIVTPATEELTFSCANTEDGWRITTVPEEVFAVLTGNFKAGFENAEIDLGGEPEEEPAEDPDEIEWHDVAPGETVELATINVCVDSCEESKELKGNLSEETAEEGMKYVIYTVTLTDTTSDTISINIDPTPLYDEQGKKYDIYTDSYWVIDDALTYLELAPSVPKTGKIIYLVPEDCTGYYFIMGKNSSTDCYRFHGE